MFPYCMSGGEDGTFVVAGLTEGQFAGTDIYLDRIHAGVMHIAKYKDPDLVCVETNSFFVAILFLLPIHLAWRRTQRTSTPA